MDKQRKVRWLALLILGLGMFGSVVDSSVVSVATPAMQEEFNADESEMLMRRLHLQQAYNHVIAWLT